MNKNKTELVLVLDRSGSMYSCVKDTEGGARALIQDQKAEEGDVSVSYFRFNDFVEKVYEGVDIREIGAIKVDPSGITALYDGIGTAIDETGIRLSKMKEEDRPGLVIVVVMTDGGENGSREYDPVQVAEMIEHQSEKYGWQFMFLGANQDAFAAGRNLRIDAGHISNYCTSKSLQAFGGSSDLIKRKRGLIRGGSSLGAVSSCGYSEENKASMIEEKKDNTIRRTVRGFFNKAKA